MSRTIVLALLIAGLGGLLLSFVYYYRELRRAYHEDMEARRARQKLEAGGEPK